MKYALALLLLAGCTDSSTTPSEAPGPPGPPEIVFLETLTPVIEELSFSSRRMAAHDGVSYLGEYAGNTRLDAIHRVRADGTLDLDWIPDAVGAPFINESGDFLTIGTKTITAEGQSVPITSIRSYDLQDGSLLETLFQVESTSLHTTTMTQAKDGTIFFANSSTASGIHRMLSSTESEKIADGTGNNQNVSTARDGSLLIGSGWLFGKLVESEFSEIYRFTGASVVGVLAMPDGSVVVAHQGTIVWLDENLSEPHLYILPMSAVGILSVAYDQVTNEIMVAHDSKLYRVPYERK